MADAGLFIGWGQIVRGREERALGVFNETIELYGQWQEDDRIESFEVVLLEPHGGDLAGFVMLRGSEEQIAELRSDDDFQRVMQRADLVVERLGIVSASIGAGIQRQIETYQAEVAAVV
jgi:hypothetical protein